MKQYYYHVTVFVEDTENPKHYFLSSGTHKSTSDSLTQAIENYKNQIITNEMPEELKTQMNPETCRGAHVSKRINWFTHKFLNKSLPLLMTIKEAREACRCT